MTINSGALYTTSQAVTLTLGAPPGTAEMQLSNDGGFGGASWVPYSSRPPWNLNNYEDSLISYNVYARTRTVDGVVSAVSIDDIILDPVPPTGSVAVLGGIASASPASSTIVSLSATDNRGVSQMRVSTGPITTAAWEP